MSQDAATESDESSNADISPSKFDSDSIDVSGVPTLVSWLGDDGDHKSKQYLSHSIHDHLTLQIHRDASSSTAFFQLKANVALKSRRDRTNILLSIYPERIRDLKLIEHDGSEGEASSKLGTATCSLQFALSQAPALIVPHGDLTPKHKKSRVVMDSLQALTKQTDFCLDLPASAAPKARLASLCVAVSSGNLRSTPRFTDIVSLYGGKGGRIIEHVSQSSMALALAPPVFGPEMDSPPSYDELGMSSPVQPSISQSKPPSRSNPLLQTTLTENLESGTKRRRLSTPDDALLDKSHQRVNNVGIEGMCKLMLDRIETGFNEIGSRLDRMEQRLTGLERSVEHHAEKLGLSIEGLHNSSSEQAAELRDELDRGIYDVRKEIDDTVTVRVEDEMYVARDQLEEFVKEEVKSAEERLEEKLEDSLNHANVSLDFTWNR